MLSILYFNIYETLVYITSIIIEYNKIIIIQKLLLSIYSTPLKITRLEVIITLTVALDRNTLLGIISREVDRFKDLFVLIPLQ